MFEISRTERSQAAWGKGACCLAYFESNKKVRMRRRPLLSCISPAKVSRACCSWSLSAQPSLITGLYVEVKKLSNFVKIKRSDKCGSSPAALRGVWQLTQSKCCF